MRDERRRHTCPRARRAFSLIEVVVVLSIVAILAAIAVPRFNGTLANHRADAVARRIIADLILARGHAMRTGSIQEVRFNVAKNHVKLKAMADPDHPAKGYKVEIGQEPYRATIYRTDFGGDDKIIFDMYGVPDSGGFVAIEADGLYRLIAVDPDTGKATVSTVTLLEIP